METTFHSWQSAQSIKDAFTAKLDTLPDDFLPHAYKLLWEADAKSDLLLIVYKRMAKKLGADVADRVNEQILQSL